MKDGSGLISRPNVTLRVEASGPYPTSEPSDDLPFPPCSPGAVRPSRGVGQTATAVGEGGPEALPRRAVPL